MPDIDPAAFAQAFAEGFVRAASATHGPEGAPTLQDLAEAVRANPHLEPDAIIERWESLQPDPAGSESNAAVAAANTQRPTTTVEDLFRQATEQPEPEKASSTTGGQNGNVDLMADPAKRAEALSALFT